MRCTPVTRLSALCVGSRHLRRGALVNDCSYVLSPSVCCTAERQLPTLCKGPDARRAATAMNVRFYVLRPVLCCTAVRRLSALWSNFRNVTGDQTAYAAKGRNVPHSCRWPIASEGLLSGTFQPLDASSQRPFAVAASVTYRAGSGRPQKLVNASLQAGAY